MLNGLNSLNEFNTRISKPTSIELIYYMFWKKGISLKELNELPTPYIFGILKTHNYIKEEEEKAMKKANRKK